jgi:hypothetical protein
MRPSAIVRRVRARAAGKCLRGRVRVRPGRSKRDGRRRQRVRRHSIGWAACID